MNSGMLYSDIFTDSTKTKIFQNNISCALVSHLSFMCGVRSKQKPPAITENLTGAD